MTRINTNVTSLVAQNVLGRSNASLEQALNRLSTGLRINSGKDDPAGLIASENLRSDMTALTRAIGNTERADQIIATADSALGQVSSLLNDIRGLVTESANTGALSDDQIAANQLQIDSSLEALNRISQTTSFQGRKLLDGSLDFTVNEGTNYNRVSNLQIDQAILGDTGQVAVSVAISAAAETAQVDVTNVPAATAAAAASTTADFVRAGVFTISIVADGVANTIAVTAKAGYEDYFNDIASVAITVGGADAASYNTGTGALTISCAEAQDTADLQDIEDSILAGLATYVQSAVSSNDAGTPTALEFGAATAATTYEGRAAGDAVITITSATAGTAANGKTVTITESGSVTAGNPTATDDGSGNITVLVANAGTTTLEQIRNAIDLLDDYSATLAVDAGTTDDDYLAAADAAPTVANTAGGTAASGGLSADLVFEVAGATGSEVFSVLAGSSIANLVSQINLVSDATGVEAEANGTTLELKSTAYGTDAFVNLEVLSEGTGTVPAGTFTTAVGQTARDTGTDVAAKVNGIDATGDGNKLSINTSTLDLSMDIAPMFFGNIAFTITGGGALFQLGPEVVSNQQARIGVSSVNTASLGGVSGKLYQLASGGTADLTTDTTTAADIVDEAINQVTTLRGRLGAFQRTLLETNKNAMNETLINLTDAESSIRDADFAAETAALTRSQILVQAGTTVLSIANSNPQNVLALLQ
jgi:flagellin